MHFRWEHCILEISVFLSISSSCFFRKCWILLQATAGVRSFSILQSHQNLEILHWTASTATYLIRARGAAGRGKTFSCFTRQQWCDWVCCSEIDPPPTDKWAGTRRDKNCAKKLWPGGERFHTNERSVSGKLQGETIAMRSFEQLHRNPLDDCTEILRRIAWKSIEKLRKNQVHLLVTPEWS